MNRNGFGGNRVRKRGIYEDLSVTETKKKKGSQPLRGN